MLISNSRKSLITVVIAGVILLAIFIGIKIGGGGNSAATSSAPAGSGSVQSFAGEGLSASTANTDTLGGQQIGPQVPSAHWYTVAQGMGRSLNPGPPASPQAAVQSCVNEVFDSGMIPANGQPQSSLLSWYLGCVRGEETS